MTKIKPFINKYNWEGINYPSEKDDWKKFEKSNVTIALNVLSAKKEKIYPAYVSNHNSNREKQVIFFNDFKRRERTIALSCSQKNIDIKTISDFIVQIAFILSQQKTNLNRIKKHVKIKIFLM